MIINIVHHGTKLIFSQQLSNRNYAHCWQWKNEHEFFGARSSDVENAVFATEEHKSDYEY